MLWATRGVIKKGGGRRPPPKMTRVSPDDKRGEGFVIPGATRSVIKKEVAAGHLPE